MINIEFTILYSLLNALIRLFCARPTCRTAVGCVPACVSVVHPFRPPPRSTTAFAFRNGAWRANAAAKSVEGEEGNE